MRYLGSKRRFAKELLPIILKDRKPGQWYVEPFVGGLVVQGHQVFVSEYEAPEDFVSVWSKSIVNNIDVNRSRKLAVERLFRYKG